MSTSDTLSEPIDAVVVFVDVRGFTAWAEKNDVFAFIDEFATGLQRLISKSFSGWIVKHLGDGAMLVLEVTTRTTEALLRRLLADTVKNIYSTQSGFTDLCKTLSLQHGSQIPLRLGWGITKGHIKRAGNDFIGADINKSARLCNIARPHGIVIDRDDFPLLPRFSKKADLALYEQVRKLRGIPGDVNVWVTREVANQFITRESLRQTPEVHVAGLCLKQENGIIFALIAKRLQSRQLFPGLYEGCGGQLARNELFVTGVKRHFQLELNVIVDVHEIIHKFYYIQDPGEANIPGISFLCTYRSGQPQSANHSEVRWVSESELRALPKESFIKGVRDEFIEFIDRFKAL